MSGGAGATPLPMAPDPPGHPDGRFAAKLRGAGLYPLAAAEVTTLQVNVGKRCNQACKHCHVDAGPHRTEQMDRATADLCLGALARHPEIHTLDITGGAPELNPHFRHLAAEGRRLGRRVIDRCNLTILSEPGQEDLAEFLAAHGVEVTASLPYYLGERTDAQRGAGVFDRSVAGLKRLNALGYGHPDTGLVLNLVYNPTGAFLPPDQAVIEAEYRRELSRRHGIVFSSLFTITNLPIARFRHFLERTGNYARYMARLEAAFNPAAAANVMCRSLVSVGYDGTLYDCDFNQMLGLPLESPPPCGGTPPDGPHPPDPLLPILGEGGEGGGESPHPSPRIGRGVARSHGGAVTGSAGVRAAGDEGRRDQGHPLPHVRDFDAYALARRAVVVGDHCLGCAAGAGSSCGGAVA